MSSLTTQTGGKQAAKHESNKCSRSICHRLPHLGKQYQEVHASVLAKLKIIKLIQEANPMPERFSKAWASIQARAHSKAAAIAELTLELQNLMDIGQTSELW